MSALPQFSKGILPFILLIFLFGCEKSGCVRNDEEPLILATVNPHFLVVSDVHLNTHAKQVKAGEDTGMDLWRRFLKKATTIITANPKPNFVLYLGDLPAHNQSDSDHKTDIDSVLAGLRVLVKSAGIPLLYLPGNNDALWGDYCRFSDLPDEKPPYSADSLFAKEWPMINANADCNGGGPCIIDNSHRMDGYYAAYPMASRKLRVIALNTVMLSHSKCYAANNYPVATRQQDVETEMKWLAGQLSDAASKGEKVIISMHIPPGRDAYCKKQDNHSYKLSNNAMWRDDLTCEGKPVQNYFLDQIQKHQKSIVGLFTSHTHMDEIRILQDSSKQPIALAVSAPGISPNHGNNPGFKTVNYDSTTFSLTDFRTFYTTPSGTGWGDDSYTFSESYHKSEKKASMSMFEWVKTLTPTQLTQGLDSTLYVKSQMPKCDVSVILHVNYQKKAE